MILFRSLLILFVFKLFIGGEITYDLEKINGVNFVAPPKVISHLSFLDLDRISAEWVAITPYAYTPKATAKLTYYQDHPHWWGEGVLGAKAQILEAKKLGLKVMLKPHVWILGQGWAGEFELENETSWEAWEADYREYIMAMTKLAVETETEVFCIGTEFSKSVVQRPNFWKNLIMEIRKVYSGKLTYAANWDNYQNIEFWEDLDYIGIDAYFPLSSEQTPEVEDLKLHWKTVKKQLSELHDKIDRPILFTEYGYRNADYCTDKPWEEQNQKANSTAQRNAYEALYQSVWHEPWMAGGFLWKWHAEEVFVPPSHEVYFSPQRKEVENVIKQYYCP